MRSVARLLAAGALALRQEEGAGWSMARQGLLVERHLERRAAVVAARRPRMVLVGLVVSARSWQSAGLGKPAPGMGLEVVAGVLHLVT